MIFTRTIIFKFSWHKFNFSAFHTLLAYYQITYYLPFEEFYRWDDFFPVVINSEAAI